LRLAGKLGEGKFAPPSRQQNPERAQCPSSYCATVRFFYVFSRVSYALALVDPAFRRASDLKNAKSRPKTRGRRTSQRAKPSDFFTLFPNDTIWYLCKFIKAIIFLSIFLFGTNHALTFWPLSGKPCRRDGRQDWA
jgi:hypothetical protein